MENMNTVELKEIARDLKVKNWWNLKKAELIAAIEAAQNEDIVQDVQNQPESAEELVVEEVIAEEEDESEITEEKPKRKQDLVEYNGKTQNLSQWAKELGIPGQTLYARLRISNWPVEKAFTTPTKKKKDEEEA